ncbi:conserved Plasmodium protein, unknown function [Plasmodium gallinaceum]|uniref:Kelch domain-containing protein n=1 Tax=Plasmodium gallinaceum TaxID=5849 RepID=A0A1J1GUH5_PLAGA|nr:conserved Plasmodium protein, unknown function [Plasmodium gallinaceum]CRG95953.1 conserved Plasmodium protein, unknown function [Plasmodium gallinaceum]
MNIINYLYNKSKNIYNRNINLYNYNNIENENLIGNFVDNNNSHSSSSLSSSHILILNKRNLKKKKKNNKIKSKNAEKNVIINLTNGRKIKEETIKINKNDKIKNDVEEILEKYNINKNSLHNDKNFNKESKNELNDEFNADYISFDKKVYKNRCDGICTIDDNIYIFDKIKKCIYLYTPYNNMWYIFLNIYEEISIKKNNKITISNYDIKDDIEKKIENYKYLNNISFINYTDVVYLNSCMFIISSNTQFMNICKVNVNNMNTIFSAIVVDSLNKNIKNFEHILNMLKKKKESFSELSSDEDEMIRKEEEKKKENHIYSTIDNSKRKINFFNHIFFQSEQEINKDNDQLSVINENDNYEEYINGVSEIYEFIHDEKKNYIKKKKRIIKARDFFSICSVNEESYSLIYLFGGKGNTIKKKNEYIDIIYNDLYVYDFFKNKWIELHHYNSQNGTTNFSYENLNDNKNEDSSKINKSNFFFDLNRNENFMKCNEKKFIGENYNDTIEGNKDNLTLYSVNSICSNENNFNKINENMNDKHENVNNFYNNNVNGTCSNKYINKELNGNCKFKKYNNNEDICDLIFDSINISNVQDKNIGCESSNNNNNIKNKEVSKNIKKISSIGEKNNSNYERKDAFCFKCLNNKKCTYICELIKNNINIKSIKWLGKRAGHSCIYYKNNLYIFGGINYYSFNSNRINLNFCNNLYLYNIESNKCFEIIGKGTLPEKRYRHSCVLINNYMFIIGGECKNSTLPKNDIFFYNFSNSVWSEIIINSKISSHSLYKTVWLENFGSIYMFGSSILRLTKKNFQYTPSYKNKKKIIENQHF